MWLLKHGAAPDVVNSCGETPLHWAAENGHTKVRPHRCLANLRTLRVDGLGFMADAACLACEPSNSMRLL